MILIDFSSPCYHHVNLPHAVISFEHLDLNRLYLSQSLRCMELESSFFNLFYYQFLFASIRRRPRTLQVLMMKRACSWIDDIASNFFSLVVSFKILCLCCRWQFLCGILLCFFHFYCISPLYASSMLPMPYCRCSVSGYFVSLHFDSPNLERRVLYRAIPGDLMMDASMGFWNVHNRRPSKLITLLVYYHGMILLSTVYVSLVVQGQKDIYTQPGLGKP